MRTIEQNINQNNFDKFADKFTDLLSKTFHNIIEFLYNIDAKESNIEENYLIGLIYSCEDFFSKH